jgi:Zn-dependent protease with chaperone function
MRFAVYLPLLLPFAAALAAQPIADRLPPRAAAWLLTSSAAILAIGSTAALALVAVAGLLRLPLAASLGRYSLHRVQRGDPAPVEVGALALTLLAAALCSGCYAAWRRCRGIAQAAITAAELRGDAAITVVEDEAADAYAVPGLPGRIVISSGMLARLQPAEQEVLIAHERAHLHSHHYLFAAVARLAAAANPVLRPLERAVDYSLERWADEAAGAATGSRDRAAIALGRAALAAASSPRSGARTLPTGALGVVGNVGTQDSKVGPVPRRVAALLAPAVPADLMPALLIGGLVLAAAASGIEAARDLHTLLVIARAAA